MRESRLPASKLNVSGDDSLDGFRGFGAPPDETKVNKDVKSMLEQKDQVSKRKVKKSLKAIAADEENAHRRTTLSPNAKLKGVINTEKDKQLSLNENLAGNKGTPSKNTASPKISKNVILKGSKLKMDKGSKLGESREDAVDPSSIRSSLFRLSIALTVKVLTSGNIVSGILPQTTDVLG